MSLLRRNTLVCLLTACIGIASFIATSSSFVATPLWIPAGLVTASIIVWGPRVAPGLLVGAIVVFTYILQSSTHSLSASAFAVAVMTMSLGTTAQGILAARITRSLELRDHLFSQFRSSAMFTVAVGPIASVISAPIIATTLVMTDAVSNKSWGTTALIWWSANALGAMLSTAAWASLLASHTSTWRSRRRMIVIPAIVMTSIVMAVNVVVMHSETERMHSRFDTDAKRVTDDVHVNFVRYRTLLQAAERFMSATTTTPSAEAFATFIREPIKRTTGVQAIAFAPYVRRSMRQQFETSAAATMPTGITERTADGISQPADERGDYAPILFIEPRNTNIRAIGFDLMSERVRRAALEKSRDSGSIQSSERITLVQGFPGVLMMIPIYSSSSRPNETAKRRAAITGFISGAIRLKSFIESSTRIDPRYMNVTIRDRDAPRSNQVLYANQSSDRVHALSVHAPFQHRTHIDVGGRTWELTFVPTDDYLSDRYSPIDAALIVASLIIALSTGTILLFVSGHTMSIEREVGARIDELQQSMYRTTRILENAQDAFVTIDREGIVRDWNPQATHTFGWTRDEALGSKLSELIVPPPLRDQHEHALRHFDPDHPSTITNRRIELPAVDRNGREFHVELTITPVVYEDVLELHAFIHDVTERHLAEQERLHAFELKSHFVAMASHEMRTPLTSIIGYAQTLLARWDSLTEHDKLEFLTIIVSQGERFGQLIDDLLTISQIEDGKLIARLEHTNIGDVARQAIADTNITAEVVVESDAHVLVGTNHLLQILINLLRNAQKYGAHPIQISAHASDEMIRIEVADAGSGVEEDFVPHLFERFTQASYRDTGSSRGVGLGLSIVDALCRVYGGTAGYEPNQPHGARFSVTLPRSFEPTSDEG